MKINSKTIFNYFVFIFFAIGIVFHFYNLNWGSPYYFHPDERQNVAYPIIESNSPLLYDQKNFDIGTFPLIIIKLFYPLVGDLLFGLSDPLAQVIATSRFFTALLSIGAALLIFKIANEYFGKLVGIVSLYFMLFFVGNIQYSHFGTVEMWEAFLLTCLLYFSLKISKNPAIITSLLAGLITALALSTKILTLVAIPAAVLSFFPSIRTIKNFKRRFLTLVLFLTTTLLIAFLIMPHAFISFQNAYPSIKFESDVTLGRLPVFYTQGFTGTVPYIFQLTQVYPFLINPLLTFLLLPCLIYSFYLGFREKSYPHILVGIFFFVVFFFQGHFFAKWARYYIPTLPFASLVLSIGICSAYSFLSKKRFFPNLFLGIILLITFLYALIFFVYVYVYRPSQIEASIWMQKNVSKDSKIIAEPFDLGISPFHQASNNITFINFYELDHDQIIQSQLKETLSKDTYVVLTSQRILRSRTLSPETFPLSSAFYMNLAEEKGFKKMYQTECDTYCKMLYMGNPMLNLEETSSVFDRPIVTIYKRL